MSNIPEDLQPEEWEWMIEYFGTDEKFQVISTLTVCELCTFMKWLVWLILNYHWMCSNSAKRTRITVRSSRQNTELDQNRTLNWVLRMYVRTHNACFAAHYALMFVASNCCTTCRGIWKLEKSQIVLLSGNSPTRRMVHGLTKSPRKFTWVYWLRS